MVRIRERIVQAGKDTVARSGEHAEVGLFMQREAYAALRDAAMEALQTLHGMPEGTCSTYLDGQIRRLNFPATYSDEGRKQFQRALDALLLLLPPGRLAA